MARIRAAESSADTPELDQLLDLITTHLKISAITVDVRHFWALAQKSETGTRTDARLKLSPNFSAKLRRARPRLPARWSKPRPYLRRWTSVPAAAVRPCGYQCRP